MDYTTQTRFSDPGDHAGLFDALPDDIPGIAAVVRNLLIHYRGGGIEFTGERLAEIDNRWVSAILATDQKRNGTALAVPREPADRVVGCCRDYTLMFVSALRHKGIPARSRIGFANYFTDGFNPDHVVAEYWNGDRWVMIDAQLDPAEDRPFDVQDMPSGPFRSAAEVWLGIRAGDLDADLFGVDPGMPIGGGWFVRNYVHYQLAHLNGDELLLWDNWGAMSDRLDGADVDLTDRIARLMVASDNGDETATKEVNELYRTDPELTFAGRSFITSPTGAPFAWIDVN
ncbi:transglutaminase domain-containing protein [Kribbella jiaozuonensis]|uniref:Transglutaminase domain-containing protein n=1 Tax=Kribbella jiaozuonensis TaxID=2575441 RepID=A0A4V5UVK9_9ACTN|nr:transglutaminase domain-containing protein [Kribbella jiaozuonensis]TKK73473.1 transglutaminase domain-containing protein [Kribbella jiaozuonensis]